MRVPRFTAEASLYKASQHFPFRLSERGPEDNPVRLAQSAVSFIDPSCGPCTCRVYDAGIMRAFVCTRQCYKLDSVDPLGQGIYSQYTRSCAPFWRQ